MAMGISKGSVLLQYLLEVILVAAIALVISFGTSTAISHQIGSSLLSQVTSETYETVDLTGESEAAEEEPTEDLGLAEIEVAVSAEDYALVWAFGMVLCGLYRTGGLPNHEDEAQEYLVADELRRCRRYEFRNTGDFI